MKTFPPLRVALLVSVPVLTCAISAQASFTHTFLYTEIGQIDATDSGPTSLSRTGSNYEAQAATSIGVNQVYARTFAPGASVAAYSFWSVHFDLAGAAPRTPVNVRLVIDYEFTLDHGGGDANWDITFDSFDGTQNGGTGFFQPFSIGAYTTAFGSPFNDHSFDRPPGTDVRGAHAGTLVVDLSYPIRTDNILTVSTHSGANSYNSPGSFALSDGFHTAQIAEIIVPEGITWTYSDLPGNPLNVHAVPEPSTALLGLFGVLSLALRRSRKIRSA